MQIRMKRTLLGNVRRIYYKLGYAHRITIKYIVISSHFLCRSRTCIKIIFNKKISLIDEKTRVIYFPFFFSLGYWFLFC